MSGEEYIKKLYQGGMDVPEIAEMLSDNNPVFAKMEDAMLTVTKIVSGVQRPNLSPQTIKNVQLGALSEHTNQFLSKIPRDQREAASLYGYAQRAKVVRANVRDVQEMLKIKNKSSLESVYPKWGAWVDASNRVGYKGSPVPPSGLRYHTAQQLRLNRLNNPTPTYAMGGSISYIKNLFTRKPNVYNDILDKSLYPRGHYNLKDSNISLTANAAASLTRQNLSRRLSKPTFKQLIAQNKNNLIDAAMASGIIGAGAYVAPYLGNIAGSMIGGGLGFARGGDVYSDILGDLYAATTYNLKNRESLAMAAAAAHTISQVSPRLNFQRDPLAAFTTTARSLKPTSQSIYPNLNFLPSRSITTPKDSRNLFGVRYGHFSASLRDNGNLRFTLPKHFKSPFVNGNLRIPRYLQLSTQTGLFGRFAGRRFAGGGLIRGPGTGTSDSILTTLPPGYVIPKSTVNAMGAGFFGGGDTYQSNGTGIPAQVSNGEYFLPQSSVKAAGGTGFFDRMLSYTRDSVLSPSESSRLFKRRFASGGSTYAKGGDTTPMMEYGTKLTVQGRVNDEVMAAKLADLLSKKFGRPVEDIRKYLDVTSKTLTRYVTVTDTYKATDASRGGVPPYKEGKLVADTISVVDCTFKLDGNTATKLGDKTGKIIGDSVQKASGKTKAKVLDRKEEEALIQVRAEKQMAHRSAAVTQLGKMLGLDTGFGTEDLKNAGKQAKQQQELDSIVKLENAQLQLGKSNLIGIRIAADNMKPEKQNALGTMARFSQGFGFRLPEMEAYKESNIASSIRALPLKLKSWITSSPLPWDLSTHKGLRATRAAGGGGGAGVEHPHPEDERLIPRHKGDKAKSQWGTIGWTAASISMSSMGVYFSILGLVTSIQSAVTMLTTAVMDLNKAFQASSYLKAFGKSVGFSNEQIKAVTGSSKELIDTWKKVTAIQSYIQTMFAKLAIALFSNKTFLTAVTESFTTLFNELSKKETLEAFTSLVTSLVKVIPTVVPALKTFVDVLSLISKNEALVKLMTYAFIFSMLLQPVTSLISAISAMISVLMGLSGWLMTTSVEATLTGRSFMSMAVGANAATVGLTGMSRAMYLLGMATRIALPIFLAVDVALTAMNRLGYSPIQGPLSGTIANLAGSPERTEMAYATGGEVNGPGDSDDDKINARLSDGEYVINAKSARKLGRRTLDKLNKLATGGATNPAAIPSMGIVPNLAAENKAQDTREYNRRILGINTDIDNSTTETNDMIKGAYGSRAHHVIVDNADQMGKGGGSTGIGINFAGGFNPFDWMNIPTGIDISGMFNLDKLNLGNINITPNFNINPLLEALSNLSFPVNITSNIKDLIDSLTNLSTNGNLHITVDNYNEVMQNLQALSDILNDKNINVNVSIKGMEQIANVQVALDALISNIEKYKNININVNVNPTEAVNSINAIIDNLNNLTATTATINIDSSAVTEVISQLEALQQAFQNINITPTNEQIVALNEQIKALQETGTNIGGIDINAIVKQIQESSVQQPSILQKIGGWVTPFPKVELPTDIYKSYQDTLKSVTEKRRWTWGEIGIPDIQDLAGLGTTAIRSGNDMSALVAEAINLYIGNAVTGLGMRGIESYAIKNPTTLGGKIAGGTSATLTSGMQVAGYAQLAATIAEGLLSQQELYAGKTTSENIKMNATNPYTSWLTGDLGYATYGAGVQQMEKAFSQQYADVSDKAYSEAMQYYRPNVPSIVPSQYNASNWYDLLTSVGTQGVGLGSIGVETATNPEKLYTAITDLGKSMISAMDTPGITNFSDVITNLIPTFNELNTSAEQFSKGDYAGAINSLFVKPLADSASSYTSGITSSIDTIVTTGGNLISGWNDLLNGGVEAANSLEGVAKAGDTLGGAITPINSSLTGLNTALGDGTQIIGAKFDESGTLISSKGTELGVHLDGIGQLVDTKGNYLGLSFDSTKGIVDEKGQAIGISFDEASGFVVTGGEEINKALINSSTSITSNGNLFAASLLATSKAVDGFTYTWLSHADGMTAAIDNITTKLSSTYGNIIAGPNGAYTVDENGNIQYVNNDVSSTYDAIEAKKAAEQDELNKQFVGTERTTQSMSYWQGALSPILTYLESYSLGGTRSFQEALTAAFSTVESISSQDTMADFAKYLTGTGGKTYEQWTQTADLGGNQSVLNSLLSQYPTALAATATASEDTTTAVTDSTSAITSSITDLTSIINAISPTTTDTTSLLNDTNTILTTLQTSSLVSDSEMTSALNNISSGVSTIQDTINTNSYIEPTQNIYINVTVEGSMTDEVSDRMVSTIARQLGLTTTKW